MLQTAIFLLFAGCEMVNEIEDTASNNDDEEELMDIFSYILMAE